MTDQQNTMTAEIRVPMSKEIDGPKKVAEIPLPPPELWEELENSGDKVPAADTPPSPAPTRPMPIMQLDFVAAATKTVPLDFAFRLDGRLIETVDVRRLTTGEVDQFLKEHAAGFSTFDVFAVMTGLPAPVLRGLIAEDGDKVTDAALDFLPRAIRQAFDLPAS